MYDFKSLTDYQGEANVHYVFKYLMDYPHKKENVHGTLRYLDDCQDYIWFVLDKPSMMHNTGKIPNSRPVTVWYSEHWKN